ncbi:MAG: NUDIX hydrolase [Proteobacteria bacterium]|nr:NUDIX hydrolase [Pseudomonadota bacterium]
MKQGKRLFCPYCGNRITKEYEEDILRDFCEICSVFFYDNPLPVISAILEEDRKILLVKRGNKPYKGKWCLPSGFAETDESIEDAALRELEEETGIKGRIVSLVDVDSCSNYFYGDLIFLTFEVIRIGGELSPGSDTVGVKYYPVDKTPRLAFGSNTKAINAYIKNKSDYWAIVDSFALAVDESQSLEKKKALLSNRLVDVIQENAGTIVHNWLKDITTNRSTPKYQSFDKGKLFERSHIILSQFSKWLGGVYTDKDVRDYYIGLGKEKRKEKFKLHEVLSALSLLRKHIWEFALSHGISKKTLDIYMAFELDRRIMIFFDRVTFYTTQGYLDKPKS